jgi:transketolase
MDAVQEAGVGHPGMPMGMADVATVLWTRFFRHNPADPSWLDRDRFVLSSGHGSMLLYALLHLSGYRLPLEQLKAHRQLHSMTPGHPEYGRTPGVETTTGPLGQGFAISVGMALAEELLAATFNRPGYSVIRHRTWCIAGDGDMQEGITHEAASLAGHLRLGKLTCLYDDNRMTIDGPTTLSFTEDVMQRFVAYGWHIQRVDGHDMHAIDGAIRAACKVSDRPSLIACRTLIGFGSPRFQDTHQAHATPLGAEEIQRTKRALGMPADASFWVPPEVAVRWCETSLQGEQMQEQWKSQIFEYAAAYPNAALALRRAVSGELPQGWENGLPSWEPGKKISPRSASGDVLDALAGLIPTLVGGSADLSESNRARPKDAVDITPGDFSGRYVHYGVREHAMAAIMTGMALHGGLIPYGATYLAFADYMRPAVRLAAMMKAPVIYIWTHDSVNVGEDGPTHQPVEHFAAFRCIPGLLVFRPADANETAAAWRYALIHRDRPVAFMLARQSLQVLPVSVGTVISGVASGAYVVVDAPMPQIILIATGSEVELAICAHDQLARRGIHTRVVSMPCWRLFEEQSASYRESVLPEAINPRVAVEAGVALGWERYVGAHGAIVGIERFGESAKGPEVMAYLGMTVEHVVAEAMRVLGSKPRDEA